MKYSYALESLYIDQDADLVREVMPAVLSWLDPTGTLARREFVFREFSAASNIDHKFEITWDLNAITASDLLAARDASRFRTGNTARIEQKAQYAAYGLTFCAISVLLPAQRVLSISTWAPPDLLLDKTTNSLRGVEVAGRSSNGFSAFNQVLLGQPKTKKTGPKEGKRSRLQARSDVAEGYIALWCPTPSVAWWEQARP